MWIYTARISSKNGETVTWSSRALSDADYAIPILRELAEELAHNKLLELESVPPDITIETEGWRQTLADA